MPQGDALALSRKGVGCSGMRERVIQGRRRVGCTRISACAMAEQSDSLAQSKPHRRNHRVDAGHIAPAFAHVVCRSMSRLNPPNSLASWSREVSLISEAVLDAIKDHSAVRQPRVGVVEPPELRLVYCGFITPMWAGTKYIGCNAKFPETVASAGHRT